MQFNRVDTLRHFLETIAFCLVVSTLLYVVFPKPYEVQLVYSLGIGIPTWAIVEFGRRVVMPDPDTGWPRGWGGPLLVATAVIVGYLVGTFVGDAWFGWSSWDQPNRSHQRISWAVTAVAGITASYYFYARGKSSYLQARMGAARRHAAEAQLKLLQTQLEPHMLFNTLANLRVLIATDPARAQDMLDRIIGYLRSTLESSRVTSHTLQAEFDRLRDYLELMAVRMGSRLTYTLDLPADLAQLPVPPLLLQPLVENAIKHGLEPKVDGGSITVRARRSGGTMTLEVLDTGVGLLAQGAATTGGFGLTQVRERLATTYENHGAIELIADRAIGATARVTFPCDI